MVNFPKLLEETYWSDEELEALYYRFKRVSEGEKTISEKQFLVACGRSESFVGKRLYAVFSKHATNRGITGLDFEAYASGLSTFCPNASFKEKIFVCFKVFDIDDQNIITADNLEHILQGINHEFQITMTDQQVKSLVSRTIQSAVTTQTPSAGITIDLFPVVFIRSHGLLSSFTLETWQLLDKAPTSSKVSLFMKQQIHRHQSATSMPTQPSQYPGIADDLKNPTLRSWYQQTLRSAPVTPAKTPNTLSPVMNRRARSLKTPGPTNPILADDLLTRVAHSLAITQQQQQQPSHHHSQKSSTGGSSSSTTTSLRALPMVLFADEAHHAALQSPPSSSSAASKSLPSSPVSRSAPSSPVQSSRRSSLLGSLFGSSTATASNTAASGVKKTK
eukprot:c25858_g1_i1.p1 GENE.c25858_g1_i1~~c25858_g1_i1.p1  ORF type:complete len:390 (+),score=88.11 c25858_g1_i1:137-1306(+)